MTPLQVIPILAKWKVHLFRYLTYGLLVGALLAKGPRPDFRNGPLNNFNSGRILAVQRLFESNLNNSPS